MDGLVPTPGGAQPNAGPLSGGRQHASGAGRADGGDFGPAGGGSGARGPRFDEHVPSGGYAWWYVDALSDDGQHGLTIIAFIGSVFSPYYAWARARGTGDPLNHCAVNVALYGRDRKRWAMTERGRGHVGRASSSLAIGPSLLTWDGDALTIRHRRGDGAGAVANSRRRPRLPEGAHRSGLRARPRRPSSLVADRAVRPRRGDAASNRRCAGAAPAISTATPATRRSKRTFNRGTGRAPASPAPPRCSTTSCPVTANVARPCGSIRPATSRTSPRPRRAAAANAVAHRPHHEGG